MKIEIQSEIDSLYDIIDITAAILKFSRHFKLRHGKLACAVI